MTGAIVQYEHQGAQKAAERKERKTMKKLFALFLVLVMMLPMVLGGCSNVESTPTTEPGKTDAPGQESTGGEATEPPKADPVKLTIWCPASTKVADFNDNATTTWLEEQGNFELEIITIPSADFATKINMALTVGAIEDLPDIIMGNSKSLPTASLMDWYEAGSLLPLTQYYKDPELAKNINEAIERTGVDYTAQLRMPDGEIYSVGIFNQSYGNEYSAKTWINKPWLDKLGLPVPTTTEEFYNVLKAVSQTDLNGNNKNDEIPLVGATGSSYNKYLQYLMNAFVYAGDNYFRVVENGTVSSAVTTEAFKESLKYIRKLFQEGLILSESLTMNADQFKTLMNTEENTVFAYTYTSPSIFTDTARRDEYICIAPLVGPEGVQFASFKQSSASHGMIVTANCKNPEAAFKLGDLLSSEVMGISARFGKQGVDWDYLADAKNPDEWQSAFPNFPLYIVCYDDATFWAAKEPTHNGWMQTGPYVRQYEIANGMGVKKGEVSLYTQHVNEGATLYQEGGFAPKEHIADLVYNEDESVIITETQSTLSSYIEEYIGAVMMGTKNLEGDWDAFQNELEKMGLSDYLAAVQTAYDRMYK